MFVNSNVEVKIVDDRVESSTTKDNIAHFFAFSINVLSFLVLLPTFMILWQMLPTQKTHFRPGTTTCNLYYDLGPHRWFYFMHGLFNIPDTLFSALIRHKFWGQFTIYFNGFSVVGNTINILLLFAFYIEGCNKRDYGTFLNICTDKRACGTTEFLANVTVNGCSLINGPLKSLTPSVNLQELEPNWEYILFLCIIGAHIILGFFKIIANYNISETSNSIKSSFQIASDLFKKYGKKIKEGAKDAIAGVKEAHSKLIYEVRYSKVSMFYLWDITEVYAYVLIMTSYFLHILFTTLYLSWILQDRQSVKYHFVEFGSYTNFVTIIDWERLCLYALVAFNLVPSILNARIGDTYYNTVAIFGGFIGSVTNSAILFWIFAFHSASCGKSGHPSNICTNERFNCQDPQSFSKNGCLNDYSCPTIWSSDHPSLEYYLLLVYIGYSLAHYILTTCVAIYLRLKINKTTTSIKKN